MNQSPYSNARRDGHLWSAGAVLSVILSWVLISFVSDFPGPAAVIAAGWQARQLFIYHFIPTLLIALGGLVIALLIAFLTASASSLSTRAHSALTPFVFAQQTIPLVAIAPLVAQMIGDGWPSRVLITAWLCWFPAVVVFTSGLLRVDPDQLSQFRVARASRWVTFRKLRLPGAASSIASGIRASAGFALIGAIVAEYGATDRGIGAMIMQHVLGINVLQGDTIFALVLLCAVLGVIVILSAHLIAQRSLKRWIEFHPKGLRDADLTR